MGLKMASKMASKLAKKYVKNDAKIKNFVLKNKISKNCKKLLKIDKKLPKIDKNLSFFAIFWLFFTFFQFWNFFCKNEIFCFQKLSKNGQKWPFFVDFWSFLAIFWPFFDIFWKMSKNVKKREKNVIFFAKNRAGRTVKKNFKRPPPTKVKKGPKTEPLLQSKNRDLCFLWSRFEKNC